QDPVAGLQDLLVELELRERADQLELLPVDLDVGRPCRAALQRGDEQAARVRVQRDPPGARLTDDQIRAGARGHRDDTARAGTGRVASPEGHTSAAGCYAAIRDSGVTIGRQRLQGHGPDAQPELRPGCPGARVRLHHADLISTELELRLVHVIDGRTSWRG